MQFMKMSYKGFDFDINTKDIKIYMNKGTKKYNTVYDEQICK